MTEMRLNVLSFPDFNLRLIDADSPSDVGSINDSRYVRVDIPSRSCNIAEMSVKGFIFADRTIGVSIPLNKSQMDYNRLVRFEMRNANKTDEDDILEIALRSFPSDRRFHVGVVPDMKVAAPIIRQWISNLTEPYVCVHKSKVVGFIDIEPYRDKDCFIHLAAVEEKYRAVGAAVSLYAHAIKVAKDKGCEKIHGRISSTNTAVMNLYARLGAVFSEPHDIFVRNEV